MTTPIPPTTTGAALRFMSLQGRRGTWPVNAGSALFPVRGQCARPTNERRDGRSPDSPISALWPPSRRFLQWPVGRKLPAYSCGYSLGIPPSSLLAVSSPLTSVRCANPDSTIYGYCRNFVRVMSNGPGIALLCRRGCERTALARSVVDPAYGLDACVEGVLDRAHFADEIGVLANARLRVAPREDDAGARRAGFQALDYGRFGQIVVS